MEFGDVLRTRGSVRKYSDKPVEEDKITEILESARIAPSWANRQGWSFIVIRDPDVRMKLSSAGGILNRWLQKAPVLIIACGDPVKSGTRNGIQYIIVDVAIAMEHIVLAATNLGLGTCWIGVFDEQKIKTILGIPDNIRVLALTPLGYAAESQGMYDRTAKSVMRSQKRKNLSEIVHYDRW